MRGAGALPDLPVSIWVGAVVGRVVMLGGDGVCGEESTIRIFTFLQLVSFVQMNFRRQV